LSHGVQDFVFVYSLPQAVNDESSKRWRFARPGFVFSQSQAHIGNVNFKQTVDEALALPLAQHINIAVANLGEIFESECVVVRHVCLLD